MTILSGMTMDQLLPKFSAVIFDMDGLAIDSGPSIIFAWRQAAATFGAHLEDELLRTIQGHPADGVESALRQAIGAKFDSQRFRLLSTQFWHEQVESLGISPMPGLTTLLELLIRCRIPYALVTNSDGHSASQCLRLSGLHKHFPLAVTRDQVAAGKPEPDLFLHAARLMGMDARECLVLEDSAVGLLAASRAGMIPLLVNAQPDNESLQLAVMTFRSLHEVAEAIAAKN